MNHLDLMLMEFSDEVVTTRRVLDRVPANQLAWKPHEKSMSLGQLALHVAKVPGAIVNITRPDAFDVSKNSFIAPDPSSMDEVHAALNESVNSVEQALRETTEDTAMQDWHLMTGEKELARMPRLSAWRSLMLNHWYHHRGQLSIYLRLLDVPVPSIYGPSADERPFS